MGAGQEQEQGQGQEQEPGQEQWAAYYCEKRSGWAIMPPSIRPISS